MNPERRTHRSADPVEAARLYLRAAGRRGAHRAMALADADGLLIADCDSHAVDTEAVAAVAPLAADLRSVEHPDGLLRLVTRGEPMHVWDVEIDGDVYFLAAVGGHDLGPGDASAAFQRIFA